MTTSLIPDPFITLTPKNFKLCLNISNVSSSKNFNIFDLTTKSTYSHPNPFTIHANSTPIYPPPTITILLGNSVKSKN